MYEELLGTGLSNKTNTEQVFHSIFIPSVEREIPELSIVQQPGKLQIYGIDYNLDKVCMIIMHIKSMMVKREEKGYDLKITCFSFLEGNPPKGSSGKICPISKEKRDHVPFCAPCRREIVVTGVYCNENGEFITKDDGQPIIVFIRGKGVKYIGISRYLDEIASMDIEPIIFTNSSDMETSLVKPKRFVTEIVPSKDRNPKTRVMVNVFGLSRGKPVSKESIITILDIQKKTLDDFRKKFDLTERIINESLMNDTDNMINI